VAALLVVVWSGSVGAQAPGVPSDGRHEFELANQELNLGHYEKALEHLEASYRLTGLPALLYNLGYVNKQLFERTRQLAHLDKAIDLLRSYLENAKPSADPKVVEQRARAEKELKACEDALAREQAERARGEAALLLGEELWQKGRLDEARAQLERYLRSPGNERAGVVRAAVLQAALAVRAGDGAGASDALARALSLDRGLLLPAWAGEVLRAALTRAQLRVGAGPGVTVSHSPPGSVRPAQGVALSFDVTGDPLKLVEGIQLSYRVGAGAFSTLPLSPPGRIQLPRTFSGALLPGARVDYFANAVDRDGAILQHLGSPALPFSVEVEKPPARSVARKWWFWTAMAGVAAAAAVGIGVGVALSEPPRRQVMIFTGLEQR